MAAAAAARKRKRTSEAATTAASAPVLSAVAARRALLADQSTAESESPRLAPPVAPAQDLAEHELVLSSSGPSSAEEEEDDDAFSVARELGAADVPEPGAFSRRKSSKRYYAQGGSSAQLSATAVDDVVSEEGERSEDVDVVYKQRKRSNKREKTCVQSFPSRGTTDRPPADMVIVEISVSNTTLTAYPDSHSSEARIGSRMRTASLWAYSLARCATPPALINFVSLCQ
jgi:hypothetical protein